VRIRIWVRIGDGCVRIVEGSVQLLKAYIMVQQHKHGKHNSI
jgi:hypothetical protein